MLLADYAAYVKEQEHVEEVFKVSAQSDANPN